MHKLLSIDIPIDDKPTDQVNYILGTHWSEESTQNNKQPPILNIGREIKKCCKRRDKADN